MNAVLRLYPKAFRDRYGDEIAMLLESSPTPRRDLVDVFWHALLDRVGDFFHGGWRSTPRYIKYAAAWLFATYAFGYLTAHASTMVIHLFVAEPGPIPILRPDVTQMRLFTAACIASVSVLAFFLGRRYWRGSPGSAVAALALSSVVVSVLRIDAYVLSDIQVSVHWEMLWLTLLGQAVWVASVALLVLALRRTRLPGLVAVAGVVAVAYAESVVVTAVLDGVYALPGNPWTDYWESIMGGVFLVTTDGNQGIAVHIVAWWPTIVTALVAGCTLAARRVPKTAHSPELAS
jgi:hypothetical protein